MPGVTPVGKPSASGSFNAMQQSLNQVGNPMQQSLNQVGGPAQLPEYYSRAAMQMLGQQPQMGMTPQQQSFGISGGQQFGQFGQPVQLGMTQPMDIFAQQDAARQSQQRALAQEESLRRPGQQPSMGGQSLTPTGDRYRPPSPQQQRQQQVQQNLMSRGMARGEEDGRPQASMQGRLANPALQLGQQRADQGRQQIQQSAATPIRRATGGLTAMPKKGKC